MQTMEATANPFYTVLYYTKGEDDPRVLPERYSSFHSAVAATRILQHAGHRTLIIIMAYYGSELYSGKLESFTAERAAAMSITKS